MCHFRDAERELQQARECAGYIRRDARGRKLARLAAEVETAVELVVCLLRRPEYQSTSDSLGKFQEFARAVRARAELAFHPPVSENVDA